MLRPFSNHRSAGMLCALAALILNTKPLLVFIVLRPKSLKPNCVPFDTKTIIGSHLLMEISTNPFQIIQAISTNLEFNFYTTIVYIETAR